MMCWDRLMKLFSFFFCLFFWTKLHSILFFFVHYVTQLRYFWWNYVLNNFSLLDGLLRLVCWWYIATSIMIIDQQNVGSDAICSLTTVFILLHMEHQSIASFENLFFFFRLFYLSTQFLFVLILESSVIY